MKAFIATITLVSVILFSAVTGALEKRSFLMGTKKVFLEIADDDESRAKGLMFRKEMAENDGMLFVFEDNNPRAFWMKNTLIPLTIGFLNEKGELVEYFEMVPPQSLMDKEPPRYQSKKSAVAALEMNREWFKKNKIPLGTRLRLLEKTKSSLANKIFYKPTLDQSHKE